jgi:hypothetical protein
VEVQESPNLILSLGGCLQREVPVAAVLEALLKVVCRQPKLGEQRGGVH